MIILSKLNLSNMTRAAMLASPEARLLRMLAGITAQCVHLSSIFIVSNAKKCFNPAQNLPERRFHDEVTICYICNNS